MKALIRILCISTAAAARVDAGQTPEPKLLVRTYNYAAFPVEPLADAKTAAGHIFKSAGISISWIDCRVPGRPEGAACTEPLVAGRELLLRLVDRTAPGGGRIVALGESMLAGEQNGGVLMTVDLFQVRSVAGRTSTSIPTLLGRAVAHEIGHLLLRSGEHARVGLMRAFWSHDELRGSRPSHWGFSGREAARMRRSLQEPARTAN